MSLIGFHRFLIAAAILFCYGYGVWELYRASVAGGSATLAAVFFVLGTALALYLYRLRSILKLPE